MAVSVNQVGQQWPRRFRTVTTLSEINVVPLVDVVLVLLVIFMLTAHVMEFGLEVEVPKVRQVRDSAEELPVVTLTRDGRLFLNEQEININELGPAIQRRYGAGQAVYLRADKEVIWEVLAQVVSALGEAQLKVNAVTQPLDAAENRHQGRR